MLGKEKQYNQETVRFKDTISRVGYTPESNRHKATNLRPVSASKYFSSAFHVLPIDPNTLAMRSPSCSVAPPPKLKTISPED
ncbi:hypothetical protein ACFX12_009138 [Malus domestica]